MIKIAFCSNWELTENWIATGRELAGRGVEVFFVNTRREYVRKTIAAGFPPARVLWLRRDEARRTPFSQTDWILLTRYERTSGERVRNFILMDRFLRTEDPASALHYVVYVFRRLLDFLATHDIRLVSGQPDTIVDLLAAMIMKVRGGWYAAAFDLRCPVERFVLWDSYSEDRPHVTGPASPDDVTPEMVDEARRIRNRVRRGEKMRYVATKSAQPAVGVSYLKKLMRGALYRALIVSRHDANMYTLRGVLLDHKYHMIPINHRLNRLLGTRLFERPVPGERFVLYTLNYAPEHSIDVEAPYFQSTMDVLRNLARTLPLGVKLYVKEHPNALGIRGPRQLRQIKALPGVRLIDPFVDSHELIRAADLVVSLSGTVSLEAALYGKWTVILSDVFIRNFSSCERATAPWDIGAMLERGPSKPLREEDDLKYLAWLLSNSYPGTVVECLTDPRAIAPPNIARVAGGYFTLIAKLSGDGAAARAVVGARDAECLHVS
jgi:hypothetical protein